MTNKNKNNKFSIGDLVLISNPELGGNHPLHSRWVGTIVEVIQIGGGLKDDYPYRVKANFDDGYSTIWVAEHELESLFTI